MPIKPPVNKNITKPITTDVKTLLEENIALTKDLQTTVEKIHRYIIWARVFAVVKIFVFVVPIVLGLLYLPALLQNAFSPYQELLGNGQGIDISSILNGSAR